MAQIIKGLPFNPFIELTPVYADRNIKTEKFYLETHSIESFCEIPGEHTRVRTKTGMVLQVRESAAHILEQFS